MFKDNPLFQDSTISTGTNIRTQFEVSKVCLHDGESLGLILVLDHEPKFLNMKSIDFKTGTYACSQWLKHRQEISYQFIIHKKDQVVYSSPIKKALAMYTVLETWQAQEVDLDTDQPAPLLNESLSDLDLGPYEEKDYENQESDNEEGEDVIGNLIDKWGL